MRAGFRFTGSGRFAGVVHADGPTYRTLAQCPHGHTRSDLATACAAKTLIPA